MKPSILLMDNVLEFLETQSRLLEYAGYRVLKASTLDEAENVLQEQWVHLAILDIRMQDENDEHDISGLILAQKPQCRTVPKIILTAYPSYESAVEALGAIKGYPSAIDYVAKDKGAKLLLDRVQHAFTHHVRINWDLAIDWKARDRFSLVNLIEPGLEGERLLNRAEELADLFRRLFYEKDHIRIDRLLWQREGRAALTVFAFKEGAATESFAVVCGQNARVADEARRYQGFAPKAPGETGTALSAQAETTHFAANAYTLAGADLENVRALSELYRSGEKKSLAVALETLFQKTLSAWHQDQRTREERALEELYRERLGLTEQHISRQALEERVQAVIRRIPTLGPKIERASGMLRIRFNGQSFSYPDPIPTLYQTSTIGQPVMVISTPGTLTGDSILTDASGRTWLTDFASAGHAPLLWNFVALEAAIRFDWVEEKNLLRLHEMEQCLVASEFSKLEASDIESPVRRPVRAIQVIRRLASRTVGKDPMPYYWGILFHAASRLADFNPAFQLMPNELARLAHTLIAMAMICDKIAQAKQGPATSASPEATGIRVDKANHAVWVEERQVALSPQEFALLLYMYERAGQLCERQAIIRDVFKAEPTESEMSRLNSVMSRLRKKIEPDLDHPTYILTDRGVGYKLVVRPKYPSN